MFESLTCNLSPTYRVEMMDGEEHLVVPCVSLTEGVWPGSDGPLLYRNEEIIKNPNLWDHKPVVVFHPTVNGRGVSACDPAIITAQRVGIVLNTQGSDGKLKKEVWLNKAKSLKVDKRIVERILANEKIEVSTGLYTDKKGGPGKWEGKDYIAEAVNFRPDHLAILPDGVGACSIKDGAGLLQNESMTSYVERVNQYLLLNGFTVKPLTVNRTFTAEQRQAMAKTGTALSDGSFPIETVQDLKNAIQSVGRASDYTAAKRHIIKRAKALGATKLLPSDWKVTKNEAGITDNDTSLSDIQCAVSQALYQKYQQPGYSWNGWIQDVFDGYVIYCSGGMYYRQDFSMNDPGQAVLTGDSQEVKRVVTYEPTTSEDTAPTMMSDVTLMTREVWEMAVKKDKVDALIANSGGQWVEADREWLTALPDDKFDKLSKKLEPVPVQNTAPVVAPSAAPPVTLNNNGTPRPQTVQEYINTQVPVEMRPIFNRMIANEKAQKDALVAVILNAPGNRFPKEVLEATDVTVLEGMASLASYSAPPPVSNEAAGIRLPNYAGAAGILPVTNAQTEFLPEPDSNWNTPAKK